MTAGEVVQKAKSSLMPVLFVIMSLTATFFGIQWQQTESEVQQLNHEIVQLENVHDQDIARLDESMRTRRNQIADLEERIAVVEERTR